MPKPYDNTVRFLQTIEPASWAKLFGSTAQNVELCNTDLSTISSNADCVLLLDADAREADHVENQASYDAEMRGRMLLYNVLANKALGVPVRSIVLPLRPEADGPAMNGHLQRCHPDGKPYLEFHFDVIRVWQKSPEELFACGLGVLPLAFIVDIKPDALPELVKRTQERFDHETPARAAELWTAIDFLMGLRYDQEFVKRLLQGMKAMKESVTCQAIIEEGKAEGMAKGEAIGTERGALKEARAIIMLQATRRFGAPDPKTQAAILAIDSLEKLEELAERVLFVSGWSELIAG